jgi:Na+/H+ antiporter NhaD/arsenite permease-like protein
VTPVVIFVVSHLIIGVQRRPKLQLGRPAGALFGASAMVLFEVVPFEEAKRAIELDTILFLLGSMIALEYLEMSGYFEYLKVGAPLTAAKLLASWVWIGLR